MKKYILLCLLLWAEIAVSQNISLKDCEAPYFVDFNKHAYDETEDGKYTYVYANENAYRSPSINGSTAKVICYNQYGIKTGEVILDSNIVKDATQFHTATYNDKYYIVWCNNYNNSDSLYKLNYMVLDTLCTINHKIRDEIINFNEFYFLFKTIKITNVNFEFVNENQILMLLNFSKYEFNSQVSLVKKIPLLINGNNIEFKEQNPVLNQIYNYINDTFSIDEKEEVVVNLTGLKDYFIFYELTQDNININDFLIVRKSDFSIYDYFNFSEVRNNFCDVKIIEDNSFLIRNDSYDEVTELHTYYNYVYISDTKNLELINSNNFIQPEIQPYVYLNYILFNKDKFTKSRNFISNIPQNNASKFYLQEVVNDTIHTIYKFNLPNIISYNTKTLPNNNHLIITYSFDLVNNVGITYLYYFDKNYNFIWRILLPETVYDFLGIPFTNVFISTKIHGYDSIEAFMICNFTDYTSTQFVFKINLINASFDLIGQYNHINDQYTHINAFKQGNKLRFLLNDEASCPSSTQYNNGNLVMMEVNTNPNKLYVNAYVDENENGIYNAGEPIYNSGKIKISKGNSTNEYIKTTTDYLYKALDTGNYTIQYAVDPDLFTVLPASATISHSTYDHSDTVLFALQPKEPVYDVSVVMGNDFVTQPGFTGKYHITFSNLGNRRVENLKIKTLIDERLAIDNTSRPYTLSADTLVFNIGLLNIGETKRLFIGYTAATPPDLNAGDTLVNETWATMGYEDMHPKNNYYLFNDAVLGSYDPNDKTVNYNELEVANSIALADIPLVYNIRFQNEGSYYAQTVRIYDTLPHNVDFSSLKILAASHPFEVTITQDSIVVFTFKAINLYPKDWDESKSHGYITYSVTAAAGSDVSEGIHNKADIVFDYNLPIATDYASTTVRLVSTNVKANNIQKLKLYPNPSSHSITIDKAIAQAQYYIYSSTGQLAAHGTISTPSIDISQLPSGHYYLHLQIGQESGNGAFMKE